MQALGQSIVAANNIGQLITLVNSVAELAGEFWECGVYAGGTASIIADMSSPTRQIRLFDSFEGLPAPHSNDNHHKKGEFAGVVYEKIVEYFTKYSNVDIRKGFIPNTFVGLDDSTIAFCHLDLDLYEGYKSTLEFVWPRLVLGGIILFDDYFAASCQGAKIAVDEFVALHNLELETSNQSAWIKNKGNNDVNHTK